MSKKRVFPKTKGDSITGQDIAQKHCDFRFSQFEKKSKVAVLQLQLVPFVISLQRGVPLTATKNCVLVITPLNSMMTDQCTALSSQGISSCAIDFMCHQAETFSHNTDSSSESDNDDDGDGNLTYTIPLSDVEKRLYRVVYAHPEALIKTKRGYSFLEKLSISGNLVGIAIDEAHMILE